MRTLLRRPDFRLLFAGLVTAMVGDSLLMIVFAIWAKSLTGSNALAGLAMFMIIAPGLLAPLYGWVIDRVRRRPFLIWFNLASAAALAPLFAVRDRGDVWLLLTVAALYGVSFSVVPAALAGLLKDLLPDELLADANGALQTARQGLGLVGPLLGAGLYVVAGGAVVALLDAGSLVVAAAAIAALRVRERAPHRVASHWLREVSAGAVHLLREPALRRTTLAIGASLIAAGGLDAAIFAFVDHGLHRPPTFVGVLITTQGVGGLAGGILAGSVVRRFGEVVTSVFGLLGIGLGVAPLLVASLATALAGMPLIGFGISLLVVAYGTLRQRRTPGPLMGRVSTAADLFISTPQAAAIAAGAALVSVVDYRVLFAVAAAGIMATAGYLWLARARCAPVTSPVPATAP